MFLLQIYKHLFQKQHLFQKVIHILKKCLLKLSDYIEQKQKSLKINDTEMAALLGVSSQRLGYYRRGEGYL